MDLRNPPGQWKRPPPLPTILALLSLMLIVGGMCASTSAEVSATPMGTVIDATRRVRDSTDEIPDILFGAGVVVAVIFLGVYFNGMRGGDPRRRRYKPD